MMSTAIPTTLNGLNNSFLTKYQITIPSAITQMSSSQNEGGTLNQDYQVGINDVVCGRGKGSYNRPGNKRFRELVHVRSKSKLDKSMVLAAIVEKVREHGRFVKRKGGSWFEIGDEQAREKVGHAIREAIASDKKATSRSPSPDMASSSPSVLKLDKQLPSEPLKRASFQLKHSDLASAQFVFFEDLVARSTAAV